MEMAIEAENDPLIVSYVSKMKIRDKCVESFVYATQKKTDKYGVCYRQIWSHGKGA